MTTRPSPSAIRLLALATLSSTLTGSLFAQATYDIDNGGNWSSAATWNPNIIGGPLPFDSIAINNIPGNRAVTLDGVSYLTWRVNNLSYNETDDMTFQGSNKNLVVGGTLTKSGSGTLTFQQLNLSASDFVVNSGIVNLGTNGGGLGITVTGATTISSGATVNYVLGANHRYGITTLNGLLAIGANQAANGKNAYFTGLSGSGAITVPVDYTTAGTGGTTLLFDQSSGVYTFTGDISQGTANHVIGFMHKGAGTQILSGTTTYTGKTQVFGNGALVFAGNSTLSSANLEIGSNDANTGGGVFGLGNGDLIGRTFGTGDNQIRLTGSNNQGAGFAAYGADRAVTMAGGTQTWGAGAFLNSGNLILGTDTADAKVTFTNDINLNGTRTVYSGNGSADVDGELSGILANGSGNSGINKTGAGTLELSGANTYTNSTNVNAGTLLLTGSLASSAVSVNNGASFKQTGTAGTIARLTVNSGSTATLSGTNTYTIDTMVNYGVLNLDFSAAGAPSDNILNNGLADGAGTALKLNGGTVSLKLASGSTANSQRFNGTTYGSNTVSAIRIDQNGNTNAGSGLQLGTINRGGGSTVDFTLPTVGAINIASSPANNTGTNLVLTNGSGGVAYATVDRNHWATNTAGVISSTSGLYATDTFTADADVDITSNQAPASAFTVNTLRFNTDNVTLDLAGSGQSTVTTGGILITEGTTGARITAQTGGSLTAQGGNEIVVHNYGTLDIAATIANRTGQNTSLTLSGTGTTTVSGSNTHSGNTQINAGTTVLSGSLDNSTISVNNVGTTFTQTSTGIISGTKALTVNGGTATLAGANTYTGVTTIGAAGAVLEVTNLSTTGASSIGSAANLSSNLVIGGGTLRYIGAGESSDRLYRLNASTTLDASGTGALTLSATTADYGGINQSRRLFLDGTGTGTLALNHTDNGTARNSLSKNGTGTWILTGTNSYTDSTLLNAGVLELGSFNALELTTASGANNIQFYGGTLRFSAFNNRDYSARFSSQSTAYRIDTNSQDVTLASIISGSAASFTKLGEGTLTLSGANTYTKGTVLEGGVLELASAGAIGTGSANFVSFNGGTLRHTATNTVDYSNRFNTANNQAYRIDTNGQDVTYATPLTSANGSLDKFGAGKLTISSGSIYSGRTTIHGGTLALALNASLAGTSAIDVRSGAVFDVSALINGTTVKGLDGAGSILGAAGKTITVTETLSAGDDGIGTLTLTEGNLTVASGVSFNYQIGASTSDLIRLTGAGAVLTLDGSYTLNLFSVGGALNPETSSFVLFESTVAPTVAGTWLINYGSTGWDGGEINVVGNQVILSGITPIPEPATFATLIGTLALVVTAGRRRRR